MIDPRARHQEGVSLVELLVVVLVLSIVLAIFHSSMISTQRSNDRLDARMEQLGQAQGLIRSTTRDLRAATAITDGASAFPWAGAREVTFYAYLGRAGGATNAAGVPVPVKVRLWVDTTDPATPMLTQTTEDPDNPALTPPTYTGVQPPRVQQLGMYVTNTSAEPLFHYYDVNGAELVPPLPGASLDALGLLAIRTIEVDLHVRRPGKTDVAPTTVRSRVIPPNVVYNVPPGT